MGKLEITLQNPLITSKPRADRKPTVFSRSIRRLTQDKKHPGKLIQVYINIENDFKVFGVFTINTGGSISFFPDFYNLDNFDHLTLNKDFIRTNAHLTKVTTTGKHKKAYQIAADKLPTGDFHLITFVMQDGDLLMDSLPEVNFPDIEYEGESSEEIIKLLQEALHNPPIMLEFPNEKGCYCVQILIIPKGRILNDVSIALGYENMFTLTPIDKILNAKKIDVITPDDFDFSLLLITFKIQQVFNEKFGFAMAQNPEKPIDYRGAI